MPNIDGLVCLGYLMHVSEDISASQTRNIIISAKIELSLRTIGHEVNILLHDHSL